ncbi:hypothetical protein MKK84_03260 [Methylobacterium sp. E-065]|uniref:hypothetical protein n=1 Tax=Methylobacterium sp. E-065 TaxID=2836583 RepID=UPI001FBA7ADA|nr:hypothetical protein [Methylobacterium sp. E-065]MCJ2016453.1 hypothetical protein [Methylobacterium sp. E-065]
MVTEVGSRLAVPGAAYDKPSLREDGWDGWACRSGIGVSVINFSELIPSGRRVLVSDQGNSSKCQGVRAPKLIGCVIH